MQEHRREAFTFAYTHVQFTTRPQTQNATATVLFMFWITFR